MKNGVSVVSLPPGLTTILVEDANNVKTNYGSFGLVELNANTTIAGPSDDEMKQFPVYFNTFKTNTDEIKTEQFNSDEFKSGDQPANDHQTDYQIDHQINNQVDHQIHNQTEHQINHQIDYQTDHQIDYQIAPANQNRPMQSNILISPVTYIDLSRATRIMKTDPNDEAVKRRKV